MVTRVKDDGTGTFEVGSSERHSRFALLKMSALLLPKEGSEDVAEDEGPDDDAEEERPVDAELVASDAGVHLVGEHGCRDDVTGGDSAVWNRLALEVADRDVACVLAAHAVPRVLGSGQVDRVPVERAGLLG